MKDILKRVLKSIKPTEAEEKDIALKIQKVVEKIQESLPECKVILGGSGEKGTWLKEAHDADIFVKFPVSKYKDKHISKILGKKLSGLFTIQRLHGSRDYFQTKQFGFTFEIVPIIDIRKAEDALNITDVSPLHADWVKQYPKLADDIRLTKQFFKAGRVYGAESYINGFSGYICEILTIYYNGFGNLVKGVSKWKPKTVIDVEGYYKNKQEVMFSIDKAKTGGPLVIIDPVSKIRNAAAAVSAEKYQRIIDYCKSFIKKPTIEFFKIKPIRIESGKNNSVFIFELSPLVGKEDVVGCKILKVFEYIKKRIVESDFNLIFTDWEWDEKASLYFSVKNEVLSSTKMIKGPPVRIKTGATEFRKKHKEVVNKNGILFAKERRKYTNISVLMKELQYDNYISERVQKIKLK